jgi:uncharacterized membrane protein (Fun14 family)
MVIDNFGPIATTIGGGFFAGILIGWALKKVIKLAAIMAGLFLAGLALARLVHWQVSGQIGGFLTHPGSLSCLQKISSINK